MGGATLSHGETLVSPVFKKYISKSLSIIGQARIKTLALSMRGPLSEHTIDIQYFESVFCKGIPKIHWHLKETPVSPEFIWNYSFGKYLERLEVMHSIHYTH